MPLIKRAVQPIELSRAHVAQGVRNELECVTNNTLSNVIRQLSSLSKHAEDMFAELFGEANAVFNRANNLQERVNKLNVKVTQLDSTQDVVSLQDINMRKPFKSSVIREQQIISKRSRPHAIEETYLDCDAPPALSKLNSYREDGKDSIKFYTDATYFFELWCQQMQKDTEKERKKGKKHRRGPKREPAAQVRAVENKLDQYQNIKMGKEFAETPSRAINITHIEGKKIRPDNLNVGDNIPQQGDYVKPNAMYNHQQQNATAANHHPQRQSNAVGDPHTGGARTADYRNGPVSHVSAAGEGIRNSGMMGGIHQQSPQVQNSQPYGIAGSPQSTPSRVSSRASSIQSPMRPVTRPPPPPSDDRGTLPPPPPPPPPPGPQMINDSNYHHAPYTSSPQHGLPNTIMSGSPARSVDSVHGGSAYSRDSTPSSGGLSDPLPPPPPSPPLSAGTPGSITSIPPPPPPPPPVPTDGGYGGGMAPPPPPPPPPPPMMNGPSTQMGGTGERQDLLQSIRDGTTLKPAPVEALPDARSDLLQAIQQGIQLRKIDRDEKHREHQRRNTAGHLDVQAIMEAAFEMRRQAMERDSEDSDSGDEGDRGWSDEDD